MANRKKTLNDFELVYKFEDMPSAILKIGLCGFINFIETMEYEGLDVPKITIVNGQEVRIKITAKQIENILILHYSKEEFEKKDGKKSNRPALWFFKKKNFTEGYIKHYCDSIQTAGLFTRVNGSSVAKEIIKNLSSGGLSGIGKFHLPGESSSFNDGSNNETEAKYDLILRFWIYSSLPFRISKIKYDTSGGKKRFGFDWKHQGYVYSYPDVIDIIKFRKRWKTIINSYKSDSESVSEKMITPKSCFVTMPQESAQNFIVNSVNYIDQFKIKREMVDLRECISFVEYRAYHRDGNSVILDSFGSIPARSFNIDAFNEVKKIEGYVPRQCLMKAVCNNVPWYTYFKDYVLRYPVKSVFTNNLTRTVYDIMEKERERNPDNIYNIIYNVVRSGIWKRACKKFGSPQSNPNFYNKFDKLKDQIVYAIRSPKINYLFIRAFTNQILRHADIPGDKYEQLMSFLLDDKTKLDDLKLMIICSIKARKSFNKNNEETKKVSDGLEDEKHEKQEKQDCCPA